MEQGIFWWSSCFLVSRQGPNRYLAQTVLFGDRPVATDHSEEALTHTDKSSPTAPRWAHGRARSAGGVSASVVRSRVRATRRSRCTVFSIATWGGHWPEA